MLISRRHKPIATNQRPRYRYFVCIVIFLFALSPSITSCPHPRNLRRWPSTILQNPKPRSSKWISSTISEELWDTLLAKKSSTTYQVNNLLLPVLFHESVLHVPKDAIVIEITPHALLQAILK